MLSLSGVFFGFVPLNFIDPSGHGECDADGNCNHRSTAPSQVYAKLGLEHKARKLWVDPENIDAVQLYGNTNFAFNLSARAERVGADNVPSYAYSQGFHGGIDLVAAEGTNVYAGVHGIVEYVDGGAYRPSYVKIKIGVELYVIIGHLANGSSNLVSGQAVTPETVIGTVSSELHVHIEFWDDEDTLKLNSPYNYMTQPEEDKFFALAAKMDQTDPRITFHPRSDGLWQNRYDQPPLIYNGAINLNVGQPGYNNPWN